MKTFFSGQPCTGVGKCVPAGENEAEEVKLFLEVTQLEGGKKGEEAERKRNRQGWGMESCGGRCRDPET